MRPLDGDDALAGERFAALQGERSAAAAPAGGAGDAAGHISADPRRRLRDDALDRPAALLALVARVGRRTARDVAGGTNGTRGRKRPAASRLVEVSDDVGRAVPVGRFVESESAGERVSRASRVVLRQVVAHQPFPGPGGDVAVRAGVVGQRRAGDRQGANSEQADDEETLERANPNSHAPLAPWRRQPKLPNLALSEVEAGGVPEY